MKKIYAFGCGLLFGLGLVISGMTDPMKVIGFLDITGNWDPSLALVMGGALAVFMPGYFFWLKPRGKSLNGEPIAPPANKKISPSLLIGAGLFGLGWGLVGICPGPAVVQLMISGWPALLFVIAMLIGITLGTQILERLARN